MAIIILSVVCAFFVMLSFVLALRVYLSDKMLASKDLIIMGLMHRVETEKELRLLE